MNKAFNKKMLHIMFSILLCFGVFFSSTSIDVFATQNSKNQPITSTKKSNDKSKKEEKKKEKAEFKANSSYKKVYDGKSATEAEVKSIMSSKSGGVTKYTYSWADENGNALENPPVDAGNYKLMIVVSGDDPDYKGSGKIPYIIEQRPLEWNVEAITASKPFDTTISPARIKGKLKINGIIDGDDVSFTYDKISAPEFATPDVQRTSILLVVDNPQIIGEKANNYALPKSAPTVEASIIKAHVEEVVLGENTYRIIAEDGIKVTEELVNSGFDTKEKIQEVLTANINMLLKKNKENASVVFYNLRCELKDGDNWTEISTQDALKEKIEITIPYPEQTSNKTHKYVISQIVGNGENAGEVKECHYTETENGLKFTYEDGDTIAIGYTQKQSKNMIIAAVVVAALAIIAGIVVVTYKLIKKDEQQDLLEEVDDKKDN